MNVKFQAEMKEPDEKFAAISEDAKRRYDKHRFIRRAVMVFWAALVFLCFMLMTSRRIMCILVSLAETRSHIY